jgi:hypothetical protein
MRKRILTVTAIAVAALAFHGCGDDSKPTPDASKTPVDAAKPADAKPAEDKPASSSATPAPATPAPATPAPAAPAPTK